MDKLFTRVISPVLLTYVCKISAI